MENLSISDPPPGGQGESGGRAMPSQPTQLPPQMFTTAAQLLDLTDSMAAQPTTREAQWLTRNQRNSWWCSATDGS